MKEWIRKIRWYFASVGVVWLVMVFWVWPAFNQQSQTFFWSSCNVPNTSQYYMNSSFPDACSGIVSIAINQCAWWMANESAVSDVDFWNGPWFSRIHWRSNASSPVLWLLRIGTWNPGTGFNEAFNTTEVAQGAPGVFAQLGTNMSPGGNLSVPEGDSLVMEVCVNRTVDIATNVSQLDTPPSEPHYPGLRQSPGAIPTLTQWGILIMAILIGLFSVWVLKRRVEIGGQ